MCINEETSWITLIIGTIINMYASYDLYKNKMFVPLFLVIAWQYALFMQLPDALAWRNIKNGKNTEQEGKLAFLLNVTQPIIYSLCIIPFATNLKLLLLMLIGMFFYVYHIYTNRNTVNYELKPSEKCSSLNYTWWRSPFDYRIYLLVMSLVFLCISNNTFALLNIIIFYGSLILSYIIQYSCNLSSFWCWSIASAGLINYLVAKRI